MRMKYFLVGLLMMTAAPLLAQRTTVNVSMPQRTAPTQSDSIYYDPARKLTWADFQGKPKPEVGAVAVTNSGFGFGMGSRTRDGQTTINITIHCSFSKSRSWVKSGHNNVYVLGHEQRHFDLTWYCARQFYKKLLGSQLTATNFSSMVTAAYTEYTNLMQRLQDQYDTETNNGILKDKQAIWNKKIDDLLKAE
jgi:hypothetical protein